MKKVLHLILFFFFITSYSQNLEWLDYNDDSQDEIMRDMVIDINGNTIQIILTQPWQIQSGKSDHIIRKLDLNGIPLWSKLFYVNKITSIDTDSNGNIFVLGSSSGTTDLNPDPSVSDTFFTNRNSSGNLNRALFVLKLSPSGDFVTFSTIGEYSSSGCNADCTIYSYPEQIKVDNNDDILITFKPRKGGFIDIDPSANTINLNTSSSRYFTIVKWNNTLNGFFWVNYLDGRQEEYISSDSKDITPKSISFDIDSLNNIYLATVVNEDISLTKLSSDGVLLNNPWENKIEGFGYNNIGSLSVLSDNEIVLGGDFINFIDVNPINNNSSEILTSTDPYYFVQNGINYYNNNDSFLVKYDSSLNVVWKKMISGNDYDCIEDIESRNGYIYVCGLSYSYTSDNYDKPEYDWSQYEAYLKIYNSEGDLLKDKVYISPWPRNFGLQGVFNGGYFYRNQIDTNYPNVTWDFVWKRNLSIYNDSIYISGEYSTIQSSQNGLYFGNFSEYPYQNSGFNFNYYGDNPAFIPLEGYVKPYTSKYNCQNCLLSTNDYNKLNVSIYPNPTSNFININCSENFNYKITSILGQHIKSGSFNKGEKTIETGSFNSGIYLIEISTDTKKQTFKFFKE